MPGLFFPLHMHVGAPPLRVHVLQELADGEPIVKYTRVAVAAQDADGGNGVFRAVFEVAADVVVAGGGVEG